jgi:hypothetical protein
MLRPPTPLGYFSHARALEDELINAGVISD